MGSGSLLYSCPSFQPLLASDCSDFFLLVKEYKVFDRCLCQYSSFNAVVVLYYCQIASS